MCFLCSFLFLFLQTLTTFLIYSLMHTIKILFLSIYCDSEIKRILTHWQTFKFLSLKRRICTKCDEYNNCNDKRRKQEGFLSNVVSYIEYIFKYL